MSKATVEINSQVNELFIKTILTQKLKNESENPIELQIFVNKNKNSIFSSFTSKIGEAIEVKSKVIQKSKAEEKYTDSISSGNAAIFVTYDSYWDRVIINMGNIPPKEEVIFISEFIQFIESADSYEFELFRNLPVFKEKSNFLENSEIKGTVEIKTGHKINKINKTVLSEKLNILEEKYTNENNCEYLIKYEYKDLNEEKPITFLEKDNNYLPSSKICFELENKEPICFCQKNPTQNELNYIIQYKHTLKELNTEIEYTNLNPALFIFLLDQSGSMSGHSMTVANKALILFLQSLPAGSYYQIIGFGSDFEKYDKIPKEYTQQNIKESITLIESLKADKGGTDIHSPLKDIYASKDYDDIKLPKNIFLLTDGAVKDKENTLKIIEENSNVFRIYSIGIGSDFDDDLIKNAGVLGKGNYNFCNDIKDLNKVIVNEIKNSSKPFYSDFEFNTNLDENNLYKLNEKLSIIRENQLVNLKYIIKEEKEKEEKNDLIKLSLKYKKENTKDNKVEEFEEKYDIKVIPLSEGNDLSKLIIYEYLNKSKSIDEEEETKLALKYQIFTENTSLFAEVELSNKISQEMKKEIIGDEKHNIIDLNEFYPKIDDRLNLLNSISKKSLELKRQMNEIHYEVHSVGCASPIMAYFSAPKKSGGISGFFKSIGSSIKGLFSKKKQIKEDNNDDIIINNKNDNNNINTNINTNNNDSSNNKDIDDDEIDDEIEKEKENNIIINENKTKIENSPQSQSKEIDVNQIVNEQNFVEGFWEINPKTERIKEKYEKEFEKIKGLKDKNINDTIAITILIIYFINKEHAELLNELFLIIEKAKNYISKNVKDSYDNIIKEIGL